MHRRPLALLASALLAAALPPAAAQEPDPPSRALLLELTRRPRLAGTPESLWAVRFVGRTLREAGWEVEIDTREVLLSLPRRLELEAFAGPEAERSLFARIDRFDPDATPPGVLPPFNSWSASGEVRAPVVDAGYGLRADFERLAALGVDVRGKVALMRYGRSYRGVKARMAEEYGCAGALLFSDPADDGHLRGETWPAGPWKPEWAAQRGSILPFTGAPGDPTTPGYASPPPGVAVQRRSGAELDAVLPRIPCLPIAWSHARVLLEGLAERELVGEDGARTRAKLGPGPVEARLAVDAPRELRLIHNVIGRLAGAREELVLAGNHRDAWVRGAHDAGGGTVGLLRAAQHLGERARGGWQPGATILLCFWDAEETGLLGSVEWAEARAKELRERAICYVNGDTLVSGAELRGAGGSPGLLGALRRAAERVPAADGSGSLWEQWASSAAEVGPRLSLVGSGSDFAPFIHHLCVPVLDLSLGGGGGGGQYHTAFDDFAQVERHIDPGFVGHELAGRLVAELLTELSEAGRASFDEAEAASELARVAREQAEWLGPDRAEQLARAFEGLAARVAASPAPAPLGEERFYAKLAARDGLPGRPWYRNRLWAPGVETGYGAEVFPTLRAAAAEGEPALEAALEELTAAVKILGLLRRPDELSERPAPRASQ